ncbi:MAG: hypothetical protein ABIP51_20820 [Bacteroidia bacterium]
METVVKSKELKATKVTVQLGTRVLREGNRLPIAKFMQTIGVPTQKNLETLAKKFQIGWDFALDGTLPKEAKSGPNRSFVVAGKTSSGIKVFYDRFQFILFVGEKREKIHNVMNMNKKQFDKFAEA